MLNDKSSCNLKQEIPPHIVASECKYKGETLQSVQTGLDLLELLACSTFSIYVCVFIGCVIS